jgi:hypothetical protein
MAKYSMKEVTAPDFSPKRLSNSLGIETDELVVVEVDLGGFCYHDNGRVVLQFQDNDRRYSLSPALTTELSEKLRRLAGQIGSSKNE